MVKFAELMPGGLAMLAARTNAQFSLATRANPVANTIVSNVPGSQVPLYMNGVKLVFSFGGAGVFDSMGVLHGITSYLDQFIISIVSDREMMPDPAHYAELLEESFYELAESTGAIDAGGAKKARSRWSRKEAAPKQPARKAAPRTRKAAASS